MPSNPLRSANDLVADAFVTHQLSLLRVAADLRRPVLAELERLEASLAAEVATLPEATNPRRVARLNALLGQTRTSIAAAYKVIGQTTQDGLVKLAGVEQRKASAVINSALGASVMSVALTAEQLQALASGVLIKGRFPRQYWADQNQRLCASFEAAMRDGIARGEGVDALVRRVRGTKEAGYADGIMNVPRRHAEALVRTSVQTTANQARLLSFEKNAGPSGVIKAVQWCACLDSRVTPVCAKLSGLRWTLPGYQPIGHEEAWPGPCAHWGCRSVPVAVTKSWAELAQENAIQDPDSPGEKTDLETLIRQEAKEDSKTPAEAGKIVAKQAAMVDGKPTAAESGDEFLSRQSDATLAALLGPQRAQLYRQGKLKLADVLEQGNRPLPVSALAAMVRAGQSIPIPRFEEGYGGLSLAERTLLDESHTAGNDEGKILTHLMEAATGQQVAFAGTSPTPKDLAAAAPFGELVYLRNGLTKESVFTPQEYNLMATLPNLRAARIVSPDGRVLSVTVKPGRTFRPPDALAINAKAHVLKNTAAYGPVEKMRVAVKQVASVSFKDHGRGTIVPLPRPDPVLARRERTAQKAIATAMQSTDPLSLAIQELVKEAQGRRYYAAEIVAAARVMTARRLQSVPV